MKNLKYLCAIGILTMLMSCGNGRNSTTTQTSTTGSSPSDRTTSSTDRNTQSSTMDNKTTNQNTTNNDVDAENDYGYTDYDRTRRDNLYTHLNLSDEQIEQYERMTRQNMDTWKRTNPSSTLSAQQRMQLEDQTMKGFLDTNQYNTYQQWVRDNPYRY